jgi:hypothetical protein
MWTKSKDLHSLVEDTINNQQCNSLDNLEKALKNHRSDFSALLKQPVNKNSSEYLWFKINKFF